MEVMSSNRLSLTACQARGRLPAHHVTDASGGVETWTWHIVPSLLLIAADFRVCRSKSSRTVNLLPLLIVNAAVYGVEGCTLTVLHCDEFHFHEVLSTMCCMRLARKYYRLHSAMP